MALTIILFIIGFILLIKGADIMVEGASSIAKKFGLSNLMIGLTIVSFGTSAPELLVSGLAAYQGNTDIAIGNVIGSNISNIALILGTCALLANLKVTKTTVWKEIPLTLLSIAAVFVLANDALIDNQSFNQISRIDGIMLLFFFIIFLYYAASLAKSEKDDEESPKKLPLSKSITFIVLGMAGLALGGHWIVNGAIVIATALQLSEGLVALTIVSIGTSLPELAASVVAARKGHTDIAVGNAVGSNIFNTFWILGFSAIITPLPLNTKLNTDILICAAITFLLFTFMFFLSRHKSKDGKVITHILKKAEGGFLLFIYVGYIIFLGWRG